MRRLGFGSGIPGEHPVRVSMNFSPEIREEECYAGGEGRGIIHLAHRGDRDGQRIRSGARRTSTYSLRKAEGRVGPFFTRRLEM